MVKLKSRVQSGAALVMVCAFVISGCAGMTPEARLMLQGPVSCENVAADKQTLEDSHGNGRWRLGQGIQGIAPPMVVLSLLRDIFWRKPYRSIYLDHWRVAFGSYNNQIDARKAELDACSS